MKLHLPGRVGILVALVLAMTASGALERVMADSPRPDISAPLVVPYLTGIMRGHLLAAVALIETQQYESAVMHTSHPIDENLTELAPLLPAESASALRARLSTLSERVALRASSGEIAAAYQSVAERLQALDEDAAGPPGLPDHQVLALVIAWLTQAADEYEEAWSGFELRNAVEYQDGYGFCTHAAARLEAVLPRLRVADPVAAAEIESAAQRIAMAWPAVIPPDKPAMATSTLRALVAVIEINARRLGARPPS